MDHVRDSKFVESDAVDVAKRIDDLAVNPGQRIEQRKPKVAQAHADFVAHGRLGEAHFVGLPERRDFRVNLVFRFLGIFVGKGKVIESIRVVGRYGAVSTGLFAAPLRWDVP